jgi:hypothetical protein
MDTRVDNGVLAVLDRVTRTIKNIDIYFFKQAPCRLCLV